MMQIETGGRSEGKIVKIVKSFIRESHEYEIKVAKFKDAVAEMKLRPEV